MLNEVFKKLGLRADDTRIYVALLEHGAASGGMLAKRVNVARATTYDVLEQLMHKGLVVQSKQAGRKLWEAVPPAQIAGIFDREVESWRTAKSRFESMLPDLERRMPRDYVSPKFHHYEGRNGIHQMLREIMLSRNIVTDLIWPAREMMEVLGNEFMLDLNRQRIRHKIALRSIFLAAKMIDFSRHAFLGTAKEFLREIRIAPASIDCSMGYWAYGNRVAFISSVQEGFGFVVESAELRHMLKAQFEVLWQLSKPIEVSSLATEDFLKSV